MPSILIFLLFLALPLAAFGQSSPGTSVGTSSRSSAKESSDIPAPSGQSASSALSPEQSSSESSAESSTDPLVSPDSVTKAPAARSPYSPITPVERFEWFGVQSVGPESLLAGLFTAGLGTARDKPVEYGGSWAGFGKRYGIRLTGVATGNAMEAAIGAPLREDPRYFTMRGQPFRTRLRNVVVMTFAARRRDGTLGPDYARYVAIPGSNFLSNTWRADSESTTGAALERTAFGFAGRMASNALQEFWPDVRDLVFRRHRSGS